MVPSVETTSNCNGHSHAVRESAVHALKTTSCELRTAGACHKRNRQHDQIGDSSLLIDTEANPPSR